MKKLTLLLVFFSSTLLFADNPKEDVKKELKLLNDKIILLQKENINSKNLIQSLQNKQVLLIKKNEDLENNFENFKQEFEEKIKNTVHNTNSKIQIIDDSMSKSSLWTIIGILLLALISALIYFILNRKQKADKTDLIEKVNQTRVSIEESFVSELNKQTGLMEEQIKLIEQQKQNTYNQENKEVDHSLALKVADEITLIERNISLMDANVKGLKQLSRSVEKLRDNLNANGYEIPVLLGQNYHKGMSAVVVSSIPDDSLNIGDEVITKIIKPQVNYNEKMIQNAQIEVSVG
jgi:hypothetical protein